MNVALRFKRIEVKKKKQVLQLELVWYRNVTIKKLQIWLSVSESVLVGIVLMGVVVFTKVHRPVKSERPWPRTFKLYLSLGLCKNYYSH